MGWTTDEFGFDSLHGEEDLLHNVRTNFGTQPDSLIKCIVGGFLGVKAAGA
jgi:hypothetical protein